MLDLITRFKAAVLPAAPLPKPPNAPTALAGYRKGVDISTTKIPAPDRRLATTDRLVEARDSTSTTAVITALSKSSPELASAVNDMLRLGIPEHFSIIAYDMSGVPSKDSTELAHELLRRLTYLGNVDGSYGAQMSIQTLSETLGKEAILRGAMAGEVALDKARIPASLNPIAIQSLRQYEEDNATRFVQEVGGEEIDLDIPTFIYIPVDQSSDEAYPTPYVEAAIQPLMADLEFNNDIRRALKRAVLPRLVAAIDSEKVKKFTPPEILADPEKFASYKKAITSQIEETVNGLNPEDAIIAYDYVNFSYVEGGKDPAAIIERIQKVLNSKLASGAKTLPVVLGYGSNSNASSTEAMLYVKRANLIRVKLNEFYSRALTIAVRIMGHDSYVEFRYDPIDLRPESELEAFKSMKQSRVLDLLSLGMLSDESACVMLTGNLPPASYKPLSGTLFRQTSTATTQGNPTSNTSAIEQTLKPSTPQETKTQK